MSDDQASQQNGATEITNAVNEPPVEETKTRAKEDAAPVEPQPFTWL